MQWHGMVLWFFSVENNRMGKHGMEKVVVEENERRGEIDPNAAFYSLWVGNMLKWKIKN